MVVGKRGMALAVAVVALSLGAGCIEPPPEAQARLEALQAEDAQLDAALDRMEDRLLANQARVHLWKELGERHQKVSAIHCQHADADLAAMLEFQEKQEEKARGLRRSNTMASVQSAVLISNTQAASSHN
jgi:hypothetical protein